MPGGARSILTFRLPPPRGPPQAAFAAVVVARSAAINDPGINAGAMQKGGPPDYGPRGAKAGGLCFARVRAGGEGRGAFPSAGWFGFEDWPRQRSGFPAWFAIGYNRRGSVGSFESRRRRNADS